MGADIFLILISSVLGLAAVLLGNMERRPKRWANSARNQYWRAL